MRRTIALAALLFIALRRAGAGCPEAGRGLRHLPRHRGPAGHQGCRAAGRAAARAHRVADAGVPRRAAARHRDAPDRQGLQRRPDRRARDVVLRAEGGSHETTRFPEACRRRCLWPVAPSAAPSKARVVVIGGGFGGATAAKYIRMWDPKIDVVLVERDASFISCPISNLVLGRVHRHGRHHPAPRRPASATACRSCATKPLPSMHRRSRSGWLAAATSPTSASSFRRASTSSSATCRATSRRCRPGACCTPGRPGRRPWRCAGSSSRCATAASTCCRFRSRPTAARPGPYERVSMVAAYFKQAKPRSKVLVLDANPDVTSKGPLFKRAWSELYPGIDRVPRQFARGRRRRQCDDRASSRSRT